MASPREHLDRAMSEEQWRQQVLDYARTRRWWHYHTHDSRRSPSGFPDEVFVRGSRMVFVELKTEAGKVSDAQECVLEMLRQVAIYCGGHLEVHVWRPSHWALVEATLGGIW